PRRPGAARLADGGGPGGPVPRGMGCPAGQGRRPLIMALHIDHVVWGVDNLDRAAGEVQQRYGLVSVPGGRHPGWGTANRIIPLGQDYLELMALVDPEEAALDAVGRGLSRLLAGGDGEGLLMWCLATDDLDSTASRLGLAIQSK